MLVRIYPVKGGVEGIVKAPPSKSYTHRALLAGLLAKGESVVVNPLYSGDTKATLNAVRRLGGRISVRGDFTLIQGVDGEPLSPPWIYCRASGTTMRLVTSIAALGSGPTLIYGDRSLNRRPMKPLLDSLRSLGARILSRGGYPPVAVAGPIRPAAGMALINPLHSSQYVSSLLIISPIAGFDVAVEGPLVSKPYIDVTLKVMEAFGVHVDNVGYRLYRVKGSGYRAARYHVPGDYSSASFMLAAGAIAGKVTVKGLDPVDPQPDKRILEVLELMGARVSWEKDSVSVESPGTLEPLQVDLRDSPDLAPIVAILAAYARGKSKITGVSHLRYKESDRIKAIVEGLLNIGVEARAGEDSIEVVGKGGIRGGSVDPHGDHRIIMAMSIAALKAESPITIKGFERHRDSYPGFDRDLMAIGVRLEAVGG